MKTRDYTKVATDILETTKYKGYKFLKHRNLNTWLKYSFGMLFKREMSDFDIQMLTHTIQQRKDIELKMLTKGFNKLSHTERTNLKCKWIGEDGYVYMRKIIPFNEALCKKWEKRDAHLFEEGRVRQAYRLHKEMEELKWDAQRQYVNNHYYVKGGKIFKR